jgi:hypothetical protein
MRDILTILDTLNEGTTLSAGEITKYEPRFQTFIQKIKSKSPFTNTEGEEVILDPREAARFKNLYDLGDFKGNLKARTTDGQEISLSTLRKTQEFGGQQAAAGEKPTGKEALQVKPSQIGITDKDIPAHDFYESITNNQILNQTDYGKEVINLASYIVSGEAVVLSEEFQSQEKVRKAIVDYAGEYLGVLALLYRRTRFPKREKFEQWLGSSIDDLILNFPSKANTNLADSFAVISNPNSSNKINISSKGTGGGAAPAISGLKIPEDLKRVEGLQNAIRFIEICQESDKSGPNTITSAFKALDFIFANYADTIDKKWHKVLPFGLKAPKLMQMSIQSLKTKSPLPKQYYSLFQDIEAKGSATDGGKLIYAIKKEVAEAINKREAIPSFGATVLQILEMNFIQQYTDYAGGELTFSTQWPAKLDGEVTLENKSSASDPTAGGFSFKLGRTDNDVSSEPGEPRVDDLDDTPEPDLTDISQDIVEPKRKTKPEAPSGLGREKRK